MASSWGNSWLSSWGNSWGVRSSVDTHDGISDGDYRRYRKRLERLAKLADEHNQSKYVKIAEKTAKIADELQISTPLADEIAAQPQTQQIPEFDFSALQAEISKVSKYLDDLIEIRERDAEDETIMMMALM